MKQPINIYPKRQRGVSLIDLMVGLTIGLLVLMVATGSLVATRSAGRTLSDSAALEQKASLVMLQIGQQVTQAGSVVAMLNPEGADLPYVSFNTSAVGGVNADATGVSVFGTEAPNHLVVSYTAPNDMVSGGKSHNCIGNATLPGERVVSQFFIKDNRLVCNDDTSAPSTQDALPLAENVVDMQFKYVLVGGSQVSLLKADAVTSDKKWNQVVGVQVCLEVQGDPTQAAEQNFASCGSNDISTRDKTVSDGRLHRVVRQTFYLRNINS
ncbi:MAG: PilW family protein [Methylobacillus sp.]|jgi:type IV pilus assembly protein PilW|nr:PilW family protein [Methylobacillus sp.]